MPNFTVKEKNAPSTTSKPDEGPPVRPTTYFSNMVDNVAGTIFPLSPQDAQVTGRVPITLSPE